MRRRREILEIVEVGFLQRAGVALDQQVPDAAGIAAA
jgi:hypothetical protein